MRIKICGITNIEDANLSVGLGADAIGFVFYKGSKRYINPDQAYAIIEEISPFILKVGVFVDEDPLVINDIAKKIKLNIIQLHGNESPEYLEKINYPVVKALRVGENFDYSVMDKYKNCSFLLDAFHETEYGGTGIKFNWESIPNRIKSKIILAGGISENNIEEIFDNIVPSAIDISSSIESEPGKKDHKKLINLFEKFNFLKERKC